MRSNIKETTQYITAIATLFTGIVLCYLSFFLNNYNIADSVLMYFGQTLIFCGSVFTTYRDYIYSFYLLSMLKIKECTSEDAARFGCVTMSRSEPFFYFADQEEQKCSRSKPGMLL